MIDLEHLDDVLARAGADLRADLVDRPLPRFEPPGRWPSASSFVAPVAVAASIATAVVVLSAGGDGEARAGDLPPGVAEGRYGTELPLVEVDDGDGDPSTILLRVADTGREVEISSGASMTATMDTRVGETIAEAELVSGRCITTPGAGGLCGGDGSWMVAPGPRTPDGDLLVTGVPADTAIVTFESGDFRWWQRPVDGIADFPYTDEMPVEARVTALDARGRTLAESTSGNDSLTPAEVAALPHVSSPTGEHLAAVYGVDQDPASYATVAPVRRDGVTGLLGHQGPIALQVVPGTTGTIEGNESYGMIAMVSVTASGVADVERRLGPLDGAVVHALDQPDGTVVVVWAGDNVPDDAVEATVAAIHADPVLTVPVSLDEPRAFAGVDPGWMFLGNPIHEALFTDVVGDVDLAGDEAVVQAQRDDVGVVRFTTAVGALMNGWTADVAPGEAIPLPPAAVQWRGDAILVPAPAGATLDDVLDRFDPSIEIVDAELLDIADVTGVPGAHLAVIRTA